MEYYLYSKENNAHKEKAKVLYEDKQCLVLKSENYIPIMFTKPLKTTLSWSGKNWEYKTSEDFTVSLTVSMRTKEGAEHLKQVLLNTYGAEDVTIKEIDNG